MTASRILAVGLSISLVILGVRWFQSRSNTEVRDVKNSEPGALSTGGGAREPFAIGAVVPDVMLVDQDGTSFRLSDWRGKVVALSFVYTNCNLPSVCPMTTSKMVRAQSLALERQIGDVQFLLVSFDTERDHPEQLKAFAQHYEPDFESFRFATGHPDQIATLSRALHIYYRPAPNGVFEHNSVVALLNHEGRVAQWMVGTTWSVEDLIASIRRMTGS